jgi:SAM-dependent MidA family methyltransferase
MDNALSLQIQQQIETHGPIPFADFMQAALYTPKWGYYNRDHAKIGRDADFITAPEISPLFGACIAEQIQEYSQQQGPVSIIEYGPGNGTLAQTITSHLPEACLAHYYLCDISPSLRARQQALGDSLPEAIAKKISCIDAIPADFSGVIIANEVLDAMPVHRFTVGESLHEQYVDWQAGQFTPIDRISQNATLIEQVGRINTPMAPGYQSEINLQAGPWIQAIAERLTEGLILLIDYGYNERTYYHPERQGGTLCCFQAHQSSSNPFVSVGACDITAHVDFTHIVSHACAAGLNPVGYVEQSHFLMNLGIIEKAQAQYASNPIETASAMKLLLMPHEMGSLCKVLGLTKNLPAYNWQGFIDYNAIDSLLQKETR